MESGLVASLNRPGGNLTGWWTLAVVLGPKRLQLAHELVPAASSAALLVNPSDAAQADIKKAQEAAHDLFSTCEPRCAGRPAGGRRCKSVTVKE